MSTATITTGWRELAACRGVDPELFYPDRGESTAAAKAVCARCPVQADCAAAGLREKFGVWARTSERERRRRRAATGGLRPKAAEHGTRYRYHAGCHCQDCSVANAAYLAKTRGGSDRPSGRACPECATPVPTGGQDWSQKLFCSWACQAKARRSAGLDAPPRHRQEATMSTNGDQPATIDDPAVPTLVPAAKGRLQECGDCHRVWEIPRSGPRPQRCPDCRTAHETARSKERRDAKTTAAPAPVPATTTTARPAWAGTLDALLAHHQLRSIVVTTVDGVEITIRAVP